MKSLKICFVLAFVLAIGSAFISKPSETKPVSSGWGNFDGVCQLLPIDAGYNCNVSPVGIACTVTYDAQTATAYSSEFYCGYGNTTGILRRPN